MSDIESDQFTDDSISDEPNDGKIDEDDLIIVDDDEQEDSKTDSVNVTKEFQENVIKFVKLDDLMRKTQSQLVELRSQRKPVESFILKYLDQVNETMVEITNGKLRKNKSETKVPINLEIIKEAIEKKVKDPKTVEEILQIMDDLRPKSTRVNLKRTSNREAKAKAKTKVKKAIKKA